MAIHRTHTVLRETDFNILVGRISAILGVRAEEVLARVRLLKHRNTENGLQHLPLTLEGSPLPTVNEHFERWQRSNADEKRLIEPELHKAVLRYARAVLLRRFGEHDPELAQSVADDVVMQLPQFRGHGKFSTYVFGVIENKVLEQKRTIGRYKKHIDLTVDYERALEKCSVLGSEADAELLLRDFSKGLKVKEKHLLDLMSENRSPAEIAHSLQLGKKATESRIRRLRDKLRRRFEGK